MTEDKLDEIMKQVLQDALQKDFPLSQEEPRMLHSKAFTKSMASMRKNPFGWYEKRTRPLWKAWSRRAAAVLLCVSVGLGSLLMVSPEVRAAVRRWVMEWDDTSVFYRYAGQPRVGEMPSYAISPLPEGYVEVERMEDHGSVYITYENENGTWLSLDYIYMQQGVGLGIETTDMQVSDCFVNNMAGQFFFSLTPEQSSAVTWIDEKQNMQFVVDGFFSKEKLLHMAETLERLK